LLHESVARGVGISPGDHAGRKSRAEQREIIGRVGNWGRFVMCGPPTSKHD